MKIDLVRASGNDWVLTQKRCIFKRIAIGQKTVINAQKYKKD